MTDPVYSPIALLDEAIASAAFAIAPEKATELANDPRIVGFGLALSADSGFTIRVDVETKEATLPVFALEYLWCFSLLILTLVEEYQAAQLDEKETIDLRTSPQVSQAVNMLNWAHARMHHGDASQWPEESPKPQKTPAQSDVAYAVNEIFLSAIAWIIHHEIAHIRLGHGIETTYSVQEETAADDEATKWIFSENLNDDVLLKRQLGMAVALLSLQFLEEPRGKDSRVESHPPSVDRLFRCFDIAGVAQDGFIRALTTVALQFQLANLNIETPLDGNSWSDIMADALISFTTAGRD
ncbi:phage exclusion protein Lit family protein [Burkholderia multivorans]|uniref:phage exclusion protein Lit family protein n=1 Tax=Burkholderia multivorans TaxID=87883 RepID=UPI0021C23EC2|nr:phage exclusion protein Lit family protein [Burkholderia multivorans]